MSHPTVSSTTLDVTRDPVDGTCPECGHQELASYPVCSEGGWFTVVKCQHCLHSVSRERWALLGPIQLLADQI